MNAPTDQQLLREYAESHSEPAFTELVRRHIDLVHSAAMRMVCDPHQAQDVTQSVFVALSQNAGQLARHPVLCGWLHRTTQNLAANAVRANVRRQTREQEAASMNELLTAESDASWDEIAPHLDRALSELTDVDRDALLLRYFQRKSAREMALTLGVSDEAAQKRVNRAVDRLRDIFSRQGFTVGAGGLVVVISTNAVQAAPVGLAVSISTAVTLATGAVQASTTIAATKTILMTTLQKFLITTSLVAAVGAGIYQTRQVSKLRSQIQTLKQQQQEIPRKIAEIEGLQRERDDAVARASELQRENEELRMTVAGVPKLRGEVARMRTAQQQHAQGKGDAPDMNDPAMKLFIESKAKADEIVRHLEQMPDKNIPELKLLHDVDWLNVTKEAKFDTDADVRKTLSHLRSLAKDRLRLAAVLNSFIREHEGQLPSDISDLKPNLKTVLENPRLEESTLDAILARYKLLYTGKFSDLPKDAWIVVEKSPVDKDYDTRGKFGNGTSTFVSTGVGEAGDPDDPSY